MTGHRRPACLLLVWSVVTLALVGPIAAPANADIAVVTSPSTAVDSVDVAVVRGLWLGTIERVGKKVLEVADRSDALRDVFYEHVLGKTRGQVRAIRAKRAFQEGAVPPPVFPDADQMLRWVGAEEDRLGYIDAGAAVGTLKVLLVIPTPAEGEQ